MCGADPRTQWSCRDRREGRAVEMDPGRLRELRRDRGWDVREMACRARDAARQAGTPVPDLGTVKGLPGGACLVRPCARLGGRGR